MVRKAGIVRTTRVRAMDSFRGTILFHEPVSANRPGFVCKASSIMLYGTALKIKAFKVLMNGV